MTKDQIYSSVIRLNTEDAKNKMDDLKRRIQELTAARDAVDKKKEPGYYKMLSKDLNAAKEELKVYENEVMKTINTLDNLGNASAKDIATAQKTLQKIIDSKPQDAAEMGEFVKKLQEAKQELQGIAAMRAFEEVQAGINGTGKSAHQLGAEMRFLRETADGIGSASAQQLEKALEVAQQHLHVAKQSSKAYERSADYVRDFSAQLETIKRSQRQQNTLVERYNRELQEAGKAQQAVKDETELIERTMGKLKTASVRDLDYSIKMLNESMKDADRSSDAYKQAEKKVRQLKKELESARKESEAQKSGLGKVFGFLNRNWGAMTQIVDMYSGLRDIVKGSVEDFAQMDQEMNNVRKYTGQSIEEVERMNEAFKKMDTRTPRDQLNQLAGSAGRLGITSTPEVLEFVDAADKINVALGDDLGKGAVDAIGKLAMAFGEDDTKGMRGAMLATGSAVNELAQNSAAGAGYLVDFAARLSGIGIQAGMTQAEILGLGAAMDENMQKDEMAATALSQIITKMTTDSETFARIAGKNVEEFAQLVKTDMNQALMQFFEAMNKKGGFTDLAPLFEQMGLDGTRAIGVLSTLASKIEDVRRHQQLATEAYEKGTSVLDEFAVQNDTYQAKLEKARKAFGDLRIELGEKLLPVASTAISTTSLIIRVLSAIASFVIEYKGAIIGLTATIGAYIVAQKLSWLWSQRMVAIAKVKAVWLAIEDRWLMASIIKHRVLKGEITATAGAQQLLNTVMGLNPFGAVAAALTALIALYIRWATSSDQAAESQRRLKEIEEEANRNRPKEIDQIARLKKIIEDANVSIDNRRQAIAELQKIVPAYHASLTNEGKLIGHNTELLNIYTQQLKNSARIQAAASKLPQAEEDRDKWFNEAPENFQEAYFNETVNGMDEESAAYAAGAVPRLYKAFKKHLAELESAVGQYNGIIDRLTEENQKLANALGGIDKTTSAGNTQEFDTRKFWEKELELRKSKLDKLRADANATRAEIEKAKDAYDDAQKAVEAFTGAKAGAKAERQEDKARRERERKANDAAKAETEQQLAELTHRYAMGKILYCDYIDEQERIQLEGIERRMLIYRTESLEYQKLNRQREELLLNGTKESHQLMEAEIRVAHEQRMAAIEEQAWRENHTEQWKNEQLFLEDMRFLNEQRILYRQGTLERINLERDIEQRQQQHRLQQQQYYQQQLEQAREQLLQMGNDRLMQLELQNINEVYGYMIRLGIAKETERQEAILAVKAKYASYQTTTERDQKKGSQMLAVASDQAKRATDGNSNATLPFVGTIVQYQATMEKLKELYGNDEQNHAAYLAAKQQATAQFCQELAAQMQAAYNTVNQVVQAAGSYFSAQQEYETAQVQKKYEKQIEAAGNNQKKVKKLQEQQQKEEAAVKTKYAKRAAAIQMAQAVAQTAISAINAYSSAAAIPVVGHVMAPIAAAMAIAAGMLQIATIKKQQQAQEAGYYEGGFTGGRQYRREAGVVHEGEFVANHQAVSNPNVLPFLQFLDQAQRNNTVGSLSMQDVSRSMGAGGSTQIVTPIVNVQTDNEDLRNALDAHRDATERLIHRIEEGIPAYSVIDGPDGTYQNLKKYERLISKK